MAYALVIGAGLAGCTTALQMANLGMDVILVEKNDEIGGRVRRFGCKATEKCNNCGVCLTGNLWSSVEKNPKIEICLSSAIVDFSGQRGDFSATVLTKDGKRFLSRLDAVVVCTGFEKSSSNNVAHLQLEGTEGIILGSQIEEIMLNRTKEKVLKSTPKSIAFIQCFGSRDKKEGADYCSRVCCSYSTRAARVFRYYYPDCEIALMYMELQNVSNKGCYKELSDKNVEFIKCRPLKIKGGKPVTIQFDDPSEGLKSRDFDLVVLSEGIHPSSDNQDIAALFELAQDEYGFMHALNDSEGIYVAGCAKKPMKIDETYADSLSIARMAIADCEV